MTKKTLFLLLLLFSFSLNNFSTYGKSLFKYQKTYHIAQSIEPILLSPIEGSNLFENKDNKMRIAWVLSVFDESLKLPSKLNFEITISELLNNNYQNNHLKFPSKKIFKTSTNEYELLVEPKTIGLKKGSFYVVEVKIIDNSNAKFNFKNEMVVFRYSNDCPTLQKVGIHVQDDSLITLYWKKNNQNNFKVRIKKKSEDKWKTYEKINPSILIHKSNIQEAYLVKIAENCSDSTYIENNQTYEIVVGENENSTNLTYSENVSVLAKNKILFSKNMTEIVKDPFENYFSFSDYQINDYSLKKLINDIFIGEYINHKLIGYLIDSPKDELNLEELKKDFLEMDKMNASNVPKIGELTYSEKNKIIVTWIEKQINNKYEGRGLLYVGNDFPLGVTVTFKNVDFQKNNNNKWFLSKGTIQLNPLNFSFLVNDFFSDRTDSFDEANHVFQNMMPYGFSCKIGDANSALVNVVENIENSPNSELTDEQKIKFNQASKATMLFDTIRINQIDKMLLKNPNHPSLAQLKNERIKLKEQFNKLKSLSN